MEVIPAEVVRAPYWRQAAPDEHFAQIYESDEALVEIGRAHV